MKNVIAVRFDVKGEWRGVNHRSSVTHDEVEETEIPWENGASCYIEDGSGKGLFQLYEYATHYRGVTSASDLDGQQLTVFAGEYYGAQDGTGADGEDLVHCTATIVEDDAVEVMTYLMAAYEAAEDEADDNAYDQDWLEAEQHRICAKLFASLK